MQTCKPVWIKDNLHEIDRAGPPIAHGLFRGACPTAAAICTFARSIGGRGACSVNQSMTGGRASRRNANRLWQQYAWLTERDVLIVKATAGSRLSSSDSL